MGGQMRREEGGSGSLAPSPPLQLPLNYLSAPPQSLTVNGNDALCATLMARVGRIAFLAPVGQFFMKKELDQQSKRVKAAAWPRRVTNAAKDAIRWLGGRCEALETTS